MRKNGNSENRFVIKWKAESQEVLLWVTIFLDKIYDSGKCVQKGISGVR